MEEHRWTVQYESMNNTLTGTTHFSCSCQLRISGTREEVLRLLYLHLPDDWQPNWYNELSKGISANEAISEIIVRKGKHRKG